MLTRLTSAPSVAVRGKNSSIPPSTSTAPSMISYGWELPTCSHSTDAGLSSPYGRRSACSGGAGICVGMTFATP